ncbi:Carbamoyltransferase [Candidatus Electronema halotolerans]
MVKRVRAIISGRVQGVGFRPAVHRHACQAGLVGFVANTARGVLTEVQGSAEQIEGFLRILKENPPPQARIEAVELTELPPNRESGFQILPSRLADSTVLSPPPDLSTCAQCGREIFTQDNRRWHYPFTNCTDCGPRFTIIEALPYDRERTAMKAFAMCQECLAEYRSPARRRFEAQPNACPDCGPQLLLLNSQGQAVEGDPLSQAASLLQAGAIVAVKGLGGYHLACSAADLTAIRRLRTAKQRPAKPLAVMFASFAQLERFCTVGKAERAALASCAGPVVVCKRSLGCALPPEIAPDSEDIGALLPYTALHHLLLCESGPLVLTSGNCGGQPLAKDEHELAEIFPAIASHALTHDRAIVRRCDDSVLRFADQQQIVIRRARGYVPDPIQLPFTGPPVLACGSDQKNTFCLTRGSQAFLSQHIGDLKEFQTFQFFSEAVADFKTLLAIEPELAACDLHPDYRSTRFAFALKDICHSPVRVQHHHAHIASCMAENRLSGPVIGVAFDGSGAGLDGTVWGGEFLIADYCGFERAAHLKPYPMPGGSRVVLEPQRMALSCLAAEFPASWPALAKTLLPGVTVEDCRCLVSLSHSRIHAPLTSSCGRLFDAVAALMGICATCSYEGQAAVRLEGLTKPDLHERYSFALELDKQPMQLSFAPAFAELVADLQKKTEQAVIATRFHNAISAAIVAVCEELRQQQGLNTVALSGGVFQNAFLLKRVCAGLREKEFAVFCHQAVPPNDGGLSLGQAAVALAQHAERESSPHLAELGGTEPELQDIPRR